MNQTTLPAPVVERPAGASPPIADYGLLADCNSAALVRRAGSIDWLCLPRFDSPAVFARILDPDAGHWSIRPAGESRGERRYLPGTLVLETTFTTDERDACGCATRWRSPTGQRGHDLGLDAPHELLRLGRGRRPAASSSSWSSRRGPSTGSCGRCSGMTDGGGRTFGGPNRIAVRAGVAGRDRGRDDARARSRVAAGEQRRLLAALGAGRDAAPRPRPPERRRRRGSRTRPRAGARGRPSTTSTRARTATLVRFSSRVLKGLTYRPTGAIVAAPTTSLPETVGGERNWDYRYAWIRDASLTLEALYIGACSDEAENFVSFMTSSAGGRARGAARCRSCTAIGGEHDLSERELPHLRGWRDSRPSGSATAPGARRSSTSTASC